jgi:hypothetical protein
MSYSPHYPPSSALPFYASGSGFAMPVPASFGKERLKKGPLSDDECVMVEEYYALGMSVARIATRIQRSKLLVQAYVQSLEEKERLHGLESITWPEVFKAVWEARLSERRGAYRLDGIPISTRELTRMTYQHLRRDRRPTLPLPPDW